jgi:glutaredoxin
MKRAALILLLCAGAAHAQMYKWKDDKGVIHFTDTPPPATAKQAEVKNYNTGPGPELPQELAAVARNRPVTLYTQAGCEACDQARAMLNQRGIPFREKTVTSAEDHDALKAAGSEGNLPFMLVGRSKQVGFEQALWDNLLTEAGYPTTRMLPAGYQNPAAAPAAPPRGPSPEEQARSAKAAAAAKAAADAQRERDSQSNAPPNFRF